MASPQTPKTAKFKTKPPQRIKNSQARPREYLTPSEIERLYIAIKSLGRHAHRDYTLVLLMFRHALRASEVVALRWDQVNFQESLLHVHRVKQGKPATHPLRGVELRALRKLKVNYPNTPYLFVSERKAPLTTRTLHHLIARAGKQAGFEFSLHPHMLRHSCGFYLANKGEDIRAIQAYLGHANIKNTVIYTELSQHRFKDFWRD